MNHAPSASEAIGLLAATRAQLDQSAFRAIVYASEPHVFARVTYDVAQVAIEIASLSLVGRLDQQAQKVAYEALEIAVSQGIAQIRKELGLPPLAPADDLKDLSAKSPGDGGDAGSDPHQQL